MFAKKCFILKPKIKYCTNLISYSVNSARAINMVNNPFEIVEHIFHG